MKKYFLALTLAALTSAVATEEENREQNVTSPDVTVTTEEASSTAPEQASEQATLAQKETNEAANQESTPAEEPAQEPATQEDVAQEEVAEEPAQEETTEKEVSEEVTVQEEVAEEAAPTQTAVQDEEHKATIKRLLDEIKAEINCVDLEDTRALTLISHELLEMLEVVKNVTVKGFNYGAWTSLVQEEERSRQQEQDVQEQDAQEQEEVEASQE